MSKIFVVKSSDGSLRSGDEAAEKAITKWKTGTGYSLTYAPARNIKFNNMMFAVAQMACDQAPEGSYWERKDAYHLIKAVEITYGIVDELVDMSGEVYLIPKSLSFENMSEEEFQKLFKPLVKEAARILQVTEQDILDNIADYHG